MKIMTNHSLLAAPSFDSDRCFGYAGVHVSTWSAPVQGIAMSAPAAQLGGTTVSTSTVAANAAKGANRKRTTGYLAFEDPL
jgi:hypothetical protein